MARHLILYRTEKGRSNPVLTPALRKTLDVYIAYEAKDTIPSVRDVAKERGIALSTAWTQIKRLVDLGVLSEKMPDVPTYEGISKQIESLRNDFASVVELVSNLTERLNNG